MLNDFSKGAPKTVSLATDGEPKQDLICFMHV
ncbi:hypothetical protein BCM20_000065 [Clostridium beijerinckii]|nr:hypothetical protein [Clostridium beijerinckii]